MDDLIYPLRMLSLCSGIGCIDLAAQLADIEIAGQVEIDPFCQQVLAKHWPDVKRLTDIKEVTGYEFGAIDIVAGGIPCQPFSKAGKRGGTTDDRHLWPYAFTIIKNILPTWVIIENVDDFLNMAFDVVASDLESKGYEVRAYLLPACAVNAPHYRTRCFIVAHSGSQQQQRGRDIGELDSSSRESEGKKEEWQRIWNAASAIMENTLDPRRSPTRDIRTSSVPRWQESRRQQGASGAGRSGQGNASLVNASSSGCKELDATTFPGSESLAPWRSDTHRAAGLSQSRLGRDAHGTANWLDGYQWPALPGCEQHKWEPLRTITARLPHRNKRLKALGNGVVWRQIYPIFSAISHIERAGFASLDYKNTDHSSSLWTEAHGSEAM